MTQAEGRSNAGGSDLYEPSPKRDGESQTTYALRVLSEATERRVRREIAADLRERSGNRDPENPERSAVISDALCWVADLIEHPERYSGCEANGD